MKIHKKKRGKRRAKCNSEAPNSSHRHFQKIKTSVARVWRIRGAFGSTFSSISLKQRIYLSTHGNAKIMENVIPGAFFRSLTDMGTGSAVLFGSSLWQPLGVIFPSWIYLEASWIACSARFAALVRSLRSPHSHEKNHVGSLLGSLGSCFQWRRIVSNGFGHAP